MVKSQFIAVHSIFVYGKFRNIFLSAFIKITVLVRTGKKIPSQVGNQQKNIILMALYMIYDFPKSLSTMNPRGFFETKGNNILNKTPRLNL